MTTEKKAPSLRSLTRLATAIAVVAATLVAASGSASAASPYKATITIDRSEITLGQTVSLSGRVTGGTVKGKSVALYWKSAASDGAWKKIGTTKLSKKGYWKKSFRPVDSGPTLFRVIKGAGSGHAAGKGYSGSLDVFTWKELFSFKDGATFGEAGINGTPYRGALWVKQGTLASFDTTGADCRRFRGTVGVDDSSPATYGQLALSDALFSFFASVTVAKTSDGRAVSFSLDPDRSLAFGALFDPSNAANTMVVVNGQLYCNSPS